MLVLCLFCSIQLMKQSGNENLILTLKLNSKKCFLSIFLTRWFLSSSEDRSSVRLLVFKTDVDRLTERRLACNSLELLPRNNIIFRYNNHSLGKSAEQLITFCADWELFNVMDVKRYIKHFFQTSEGQILSLPWHVGPSWPNLSHWQILWGWIREEWQGISQGQPPNTRSVRRQDNTKIPTWACLDHLCWSILFGITRTW